jgi:hypothetical protein
MLDKEAVIKLLATNDQAIARALLVLHENQTADERNSDATRHHNGKGFRPAHAYMGSNMAKFYIARGYLSVKQVAYWRKPNSKGDMRIAIYWRQLIEAAQAKAAKQVVIDAEAVSFNYGHNVAVA